MLTWRNLMLLVPGAIGVAGCSLPASKLDIRPAIWSRTWFADYRSAQTFARESNLPLLIYYKDAKPWSNDPIEDALRGWPLSKHTDACARVALLRSYEPDRRVVRQFGIVRAPAVVLVHADGTYHAVSGDLSGDRLTSFFEQAKPPGSWPTPDPFPSQPVGFAWQTSLDDALAQGRTNDRPVFIVLDRPWSRDWERLSPMIDRPEVRSRAADMVHCRPMPIWKIAPDYTEQFALANLPAIVVVQPDGSYRSLEIPNSYEAIVRFLDGSDQDSVNIETAAPTTASSNKPAESD